MPRARDNRRQKLYDAERSVNLPDSKAATKYLREGGKVLSTGNVSIEACQSYVEYVASAAWFQSRWGKRTMVCRHKVYGSATASHDGTHISLPPWGRTERVILHEMAHHLTPRQYAAHGPEFAGILLTLVRYQCGTEAASMLRAAFKTHRVRYSMSVVPKPGTRTVTPRTEMVKTKTVAKRREIESRKAGQDLQRRIIVGWQRRRESVETMRALISDGFFGEPGTKSRLAALATARKLEGK